MFSSAIKSLSSNNISSNYEISKTPVALSGPWKIFDARKKSGGKQVSVFLFERKSLEPPGSGFGSKSNSSALRKVHDEVVDRLKREVGALARLRHPSILSLEEPVEETREGGLRFATEPVTASLASVLEERDAQESAGGSGTRRSRFVVEDADGGRRRREVEIDELEIQKGLLQVGKGLEFLHTSAGLVHADLTPSNIYINAKSDWKIAGLGFSTPPSNASNGAAPTISLSEVLNHDPRLPKSVQLDIDYTSPDFVMDNNITASADMFSLGLVIIALYNSPHQSCLETGQSTSNYRRIFSSSTNIPTHNNNFLIRQNLPRDIKAEVLPKLITRRPAQRLGAREFQQAQYFDNILVSTIRFLESLPAKTANEKLQFLRGLPRILPQFPQSVLEKKVLPALLEESKDFDLLALILQNAFKTIEHLSSSKRAFQERMLPSLRSIFAQPKAAKGKDVERDSRREAGLLMVIDNMHLITQNCSGQEFRDDVLPLLYMAFESPTAACVDRALQSVSSILPVLDFSTIKNDLFPVVAHVFTKTSSMTIKIQSLKTIGLLCGATTEEANDLSGTVESTRSQSSSSSILDKYTIQEKVIPLLKNIKTKEPAVSMSALTVFKHIGKVCDTDFVALEIIPILWSFSLGPLLNLQQFRSFMTLIKSLSSRIETEQSRKLSDLSTGSGMAASRSSSTMHMNGRVNGNDAGGETDFESLVTGRRSNVDSNNFLDGGWTGETSARTASNTSSGPSFSWSTTPSSQNTSLQPPSTISRTITPDQLSSYATLAPTNAATSNPWAQPLQPQQSQFSPVNTISSPKPMNSFHTRETSVDWSSAAPKSSTDIWGKPNVMSPIHPSSSAGGFGATSRPQQSSTNSMSGFNIAPPPNRSTSNNSLTNQNMSQKQGLDKYESLI